MQIMMQGGVACCSLLSYPPRLVVLLLWAACFLALAPVCCHAFFLQSPQQQQQQQQRHSFFPNPQHQHQHSSRWRRRAPPNQFSTITTITTSTSTTSSLSMALVPLPTRDLQQLVAVGSPTAAQYASYWGRTERERYARLVESCIVSFVGCFFSYFMSFVLGGFVATILGTTFLFWAVLSPQFKAYQRNWEFLGGRELVDPWSVPPGQDPERAGLYGALFLGHIDDVCVVQDADAADPNQEYDLTEFDDYRMDEDELERFSGEPYLLRVRLADATGRALQIHARLSEEYLDVQPGMPCMSILLSLSSDFHRLAAVTDLFVPDAKCWIGDYPYLDRAEVETLFARDDDLWDALQEEATAQDFEADEIMDAGSNLPYDDSDYNQPFEGDDPMPLRRRISS